MLCNPADFIQAQLTRKHHPMKAEFFEHPHAFEVVDAHLRRRVQPQIRRVFLDEAYQAQVIDNHGVDAGRTGASQHLPGQFEFRIQQYGVERQINLHAVQMAVRRRFVQLRFIKIRGVAARVKLLRAEIDRIGAAVNGRLYAFHPAAGREYF